MTVALLVHLECACHVLCIAHHGYWYISHKYGTYYGVLFLRVHADKCGTYTVGYLPTVNNYIRFHAMQLLYCCGVGIDLYFSFIVAILINDNGESIACLCIDEATDSYH